MAPPELPGAPQSATSATSTPTCDALAAFTFQLWLVMHLRRPIFIFNDVWCTCQRLSGRPARRADAVQIFLHDPLMTAATSEGHCSPLTPKHKKSANFSEIFRYLPIPNNSKIRNLQFRWNDRKANFISLGTKLSTSSGIPRNLHQNRFEKRRNWDKNRKWKFEKFATHSWMKIIQKTIWRNLVEIHFPSLERCRRIYILHGKI